MGLLSDKGEAASVTRGPQTCHPPGHPCARSPSPHPPRLPTEEEALVPGVEDSSSEAPCVASPSLSTVSQGKKGTLEPGVLKARLPGTANSVTQAWCLTTRGAGVPALRTGQSGPMPHWYAFSLRCFLRLPPMSKIGSSAWNLRSQQSSPGLRCGCCSPRRRSRSPCLSGCLSSYSQTPGCLRMPVVMMQSARKAVVLQLLTSIS